MTDLLTSDAMASIFLRKEALAAGYTDRNIAAMVRSHELVRVRRGAYIAGALWDREDAAGRHALVARSVLKQSCTPVVLSHVSALPEYDAPTWGMPLDQVHLTRLDRRAGRKEAGVRQHRGRLLAEDVESRRGVDVTTATRLAIDITTVATVEAALCVVNHLIHAELTTLERIAARYATMQQDPFTLRTDLVLRLAHPRIESVGETRTWFCCWTQGLPAPEPQWVVSEHGREIARLDFAWPELGVWLEFDGRQKYLRFLREGETVTDAVLREKRREERITELTGWRCIRITWADLADSVRLAARLRAFLRLAATAP